jgi:hypothetical protein
MVGVELKLRCRFSAARSLKSLFEVDRFERFLNLFEFLLDVGLDMWSHQQYINHISEEFVTGYRFSPENTEKSDRMKDILSRWLELLLFLWH